MKNKNFLNNALSYVASAALCLTLTSLLTNTSAQSIAISTANSVFPSDIAYPTKVIPLGTAVGIKMYADGMIIAGISDVETSDGAVSPLKDAGIDVGDVILKIDGKPISSGSQFENIISSSDGQPLTIEYQRDGKSYTATVTPQKSTVDEKYRIGAWIRDSMAGVGTVTFVDPQNGTFGALGHAICDVDTGSIMPLRIGSIMPATVTEVKKGTPGDPGELRCAFDVKDNIGSLISNTNQGIFGIFSNSSSYDNFQPVQIADKSEIQEGQAFIYSTIEGSDPKQYEIEISKVYSGQRSDGKNMLIKIVDQDLIEKTGGIVQGMSGSPIIQNGKIVGAVTHVLVNDPKKGYGIFIENMLNKAYSSSDEEQQFSQFEVLPDAA